MDKEKHLKHLMEMKSGSVKAFSEDIGLAYTTVRSILERGVFNAKVENIIKICKGLNIKPENIMDLNDTIISESITTLIKLTPPRQENVLNYANEQLDEQNKVTSIDEYKESKLVSYIACGATGAGIGEELYDDILHEEVFFKEDETPSNADFCILVNGDSMEPMLKQGTYAFIKKEDSIKDGTIALVVLDGVSLIKRVDICEDYINLVSLNPKYDDIKVASFSNIKVMGKVVL
ncbi:XRE family transcriptional regulator [Staphylococcus aureus]|uniref:XRE family transcriptional regulator n=2 Tax=Staphylococcus aureus TaxID=1280 RepID=UPI000ACB098A|nr:XRE family transcriptional regulator [Staphylococcus aureus]MDX8583889.1 XRE family transcriptional regulator [Staphylococcus aureus]MDX8682654.1 XRE family transcriptional regulator [Staphylococcus aureus]MDX8682834.1 XRE family transcriptional regulator [Staphylococcus aureus]HDC9279723.1 helix-turn-helix transcriptional regulator [Staphylococcus aureus]HEJ6647519.1 helix-turn-helix transcriptional regulator [Staphylococcus aureus]